MAAVKCPKCEFTNTDRDPLCVRCRHKLRPDTPKNDNREFEPTRPTLRDFAIAAGAVLAASALVVLWHLYSERPQVDLRPARVASFFIALAGGPATGWFVAVQYEGSGPTFPGALGTLLPATGLSLVPAAIWLRSGARVALAVSAFFWYWSGW